MKALLLSAVILGCLAYYMQDTIKWTWKTYNILDVIEAHLLLPEYFFSSGSQPATPAGRLFTKEELTRHKFSHLSIVGEVYDVSSGEKHYGKGGHYSFFTGVDGTRAFATGEFNEKGLREDVSDLKPSDVQGIEGFRTMYVKDYKYVGKLIGHYYDENGQETDKKAEYRELLKRAEREQADKEEFFKLFPPCNSEFNGKRSRVWCSNRSGGVARTWIGVPRRLYSPGKPDSFRCACIRTTGPPSNDLESSDHSNRGDLDSPHIREYEGCNSQSESCEVLK